MLNLELNIIALNLLRNITFCMYMCSLWFTRIIRVQNVAFSCVKDTVYFTAQCMKLNKKVMFHNLSLFFCEAALQLYTCFDNFISCETIDH